METLQVISVIVNILAVAIPLVYSIVTTIVNAIKTKNYNTLIELIYGWIKEAEQNCISGADKKEWVMDMIQSTCGALHLTYEEEKFGSMVDQIIDVTKHVNITPDKLTPITTEPLTGLEVVTEVKPTEVNVKSSEDEGVSVADLFRMAEEENKRRAEESAKHKTFNLNMFTGLDIHHRCYVATMNNKNKYKMTSHYGIVVHDTGSGAPNKHLKRWYQPDKDNENYDEIIKAVGLNSNGNGSNNTTGDKIAHAYIGELADGKSVGIGQALPFEGFPCWSAATGSKGSFNGDPTACLQVEVARGTDSDIEYYHKAYAQLIELLAYWCYTYNISVDHIYSHLEGHKLGYASNHGDIDDYLKLDGKTMDDLRKDVANRLK